MGEVKRVGWVERSDTHHCIYRDDGFRRLNPSYELAMTLANIVARMEPTGRANARPMTGSAKSENHATPVPDCASLHPGYSLSTRTRSGSSDLPVGRFVDEAVESFLSDFPKNICCRLTQIKSRTVAIPPHQSNCAGSRPVIGRPQGWR